MDDAQKKVEKLLKSWDPTGVTGQTKKLSKAKQLQNEIDAHLLKKKNEQEGTPVE